MMVDHSSASPPALLVDLSLQFGGASVRAAELVRGAGNTHWALAVLHDSPACRHAHQLGLETFEVGSLRTDPGTVGRLVKVIQSGGYQIVDGQNPQSKLWGAIAAWRTNTAFVSTLNSWPLSEYGTNLKGYTYTLLERMLRRRTHLYIAVSTQIREKLLEDGVPSTSIVYIPTAVELNPDSVAADPVEVRRLLGLSPDAILCIAVGRLAEAKGYPILLAAMQRLCDRFPNLHCLIVGEGALKARLRAEIEQLGLRGKVILLGFRPREETLSLVLSSNFFVMPSLTEGTPVALLEAAALARPIVVSAVGGIPSLLKDGDHARLIHPADADQLAAEIEELITHQDEARAMAGRAQQHVRKYFGLTQQVQATQEAYRQALFKQGKSLRRDQG